MHDNKGCGNVHYTCSLPQTAKKITSQCRVCVLISLIFSNHDQRVGWSRRGGRRGLLESEDGPVSGKTPSLGVQRDDGEDILQTLSESNRHEVTSSKRSCSSLIFYWVFTDACESYSFMKFFCEEWQLNSMDHEPYYYYTSFWHKLLLFVKTAIK